MLVGTLPRVSGGVIPDYNACESCISSYVSAVRVNVTRKNPHVGKPSHGWVTLHKLRATLLARRYFSADVNLHDIYPDGQHLARILSLTQRPGYAKSLSWSQTFFIHANIRMVRPIPEFLFSASHRVIH